MPDFPVINKVLEIHADEVAFLYTQRKNSIISPAFNLSDIAHMDNRLSGHIDGLLLGGKNSWDFCEQGLEIGDDGEVFAAAVFAIGNKDFNQLDQVFEVAGDDAVLLDAIADAFVWSDFEMVKQPLNKLLQLDIDEKIYVALTALSEFRCDLIKYEKYIIKALESDNILLQQRALTIIGIIDMPACQPYLVNAMKSDDENIAFLANRSATRFGNAEGLERLKTFVTHPVFGEQALLYIILQKDMENTVEMLRNLYKDDSTQRLSILGLGYIGKTNSIPSLIQLMDNPELSRIAGYAFSMITGVNLETAGLVADKPDGVDAGPTEDPEDDNVESDQDEDLPWPDSEKIRHWWSQTENHSQYSSSERYLCGKTMSKKELKVALKEGDQCLRIFAASCLGAYERDKPMFNVHSPAKYQIAVLS